MALNIPPKGDSFRRAGAHFANLEVSPQDTPNMTVKTSAGGFWDDNTTYVEHNGGTSPTLTAPSGNAKLTVIALNLSGALVLIDGAEAASPSLPVIPSDRIALAVVLLNTTDTTIDDSMVFDLRPVFQVGADVNNLLVAEVVGLASQLALKADDTALTNGLATKADVAGTASSIFSLNANHTGAPTADASFRVERGAQADVELRWNETTEVWEFTNDGTTFEAISSASSVLASVAANASAITVLNASVAAVITQASNNASVITVHTTELATASTDIAALQAASSHPVDLSGFHVGVIAASAIAFMWPIRRAITLPLQNALGAYTATVDIDNISFNIKRSITTASAVNTASVIGTVAFGSAQTAGSVNLAASVDVVAGGVIFLQADVVSASNTLADFGFTIQGRTT